MAPGHHLQTADLLRNYCYVDGLMENILHVSEAKRFKSAPLDHNCSGMSRDLSSSFKCKLY